MGKHKNGRKSNSQQKRKNKASKGCTTHQAEHTSASSHCNSSACHTPNQPKRPEEVAASTDRSKKQSEQVSAKKMQENVDSVYNADALRCCEQCRKFGVCMRNATYEFKPVDGLLVGLGVCVFIALLVLLSYPILAGKTIARQRVSLIMAVFSLISLLLFPSDRLKCLVERIRRRPFLVIKCFVRWNACHKRLAVMGAFVLSFVLVVGSSMLFSRLPIYERLSDLITWLCLLYFCIVAIRD